MSRLEALRQNELGLPGRAHTNIIEVVLEPLFGCAPPNIVELLEKGPFGVEFA
jgi:hypothetical protein